MKLIKLSDLFNVSYGTKLDMNKMSVKENSNIAFVSRSSKNNGIVAYVDRHNDIAPLPAGLITVTLGGTYLLSSFLQETAFYTAQNVAVLESKTKLTMAEKLYYCLCISKNRFRYSAFGREANRTLKNILVPSIDEIPNWVNEINLTRFEGINQTINNEVLNCDISQWKSFRFDELFTIKKGKRLTKVDMLEGDIPFIGSTDSNNGITNKINQKPNHQGNVITVNYNGSVGEAFYQSVPFCASDDVNILYPKKEMFSHFNQYIGLFIIPLIKANKFRFNYGRKWHKERMEGTILKLPINSQEIIDIDFMERYIKTLPFSSKI